MNKIRRITNFALFLSLSYIVALGLTVSPAWSQQASGAITGTITDAVRRGCRQRHGHDSRRGSRHHLDHARSNTAGVYNFPQVTVGNVEVSVEATGFSKQVHPAFTLILNQIARVDFQLSVGQVSQTVEVTTAPPLLQTDSTDLGTLIDANAAVSLPLATRNINQLTLARSRRRQPQYFCLSGSADHLRHRPSLRQRRSRAGQQLLAGRHGHQPGRQQRSGLRAQSGRHSGIQSDRRQRSGGLRQLSSAAWSSRPSSRAPIHITATFTSFCAIPP